MNYHESLSQQVKELQIEVASLRTAYGKFLTPVASKKIIKVFIERKEGERKPYLVIVKGNRTTTFQLSLTRMAVFLSVVLDWKNRTTGGEGIGDTRVAAFEILRQLNQELLDSRKVQEQVRVAMYRFESFWNVGLASILPAQFDSENFRLNASVPESKLSLEISSTDIGIEQVLSEALPNFILNRLLTESCLFIPGNRDLVEKFLLQVYEHAPLTAVSAYFRPQMIGYHPELLSKIVPSSNVKGRYDLMHKQMQEGRLRFTEILEEDHIVRLFTPNADGTYPLFPGCTRDDVIKYFDFIDDLIFRKVGYQLNIVKARIPFYVTTYESRHFDITSFFSTTEERSVNAPGSFAVSSKETVNSIKSSVFRWLIEHPSAITAPAQVRKRLGEIREAALLSL
jgi:hypothetical protein